MKLTMTKTMVVAAALVAFAVAGQAQTTVRHNKSTVTSEGSGQGEGTGSGASGQGTSSTVKDDLFAGTEIFAKNATDVTEITMDPDTLGEVIGKDKPKAQNMVLNVVRTYEYDKPGMYDMAEVDKFRNKLNTGDWHCSMHTRNMKTGESTDVCNKHRTDDLYESAIITVEPKELTFIHTISHHATSMMMPGMSGLGVFPGSLAGLKSLAMMGPEMMQLQMNLNSLKSGMTLNMAPMALNLGDWAQMDGEAIEKAIEKSQKDWEKSQKDWDKSGMKMKEFSTPDGKKTFIITPDSSDSPTWTIAPDAPKSLEAVPAMPAPPAPEGAPAPPAQAAPAAPATPRAQPAPAPQQF